MLNSPLQYSENAKFNCGGFIAAEEEIDVLLKTKVYDITELIIIKELYKYKYLSINDIKKLLSIKLKPKLQKPKYTGNINKLIRYGHIKKAEYIVEEERGITVYFLTNAAYEFCRRKYINKPVTYEGIIDTSDISEILTRTSLNQFHIDTLVTKASVITKETYYGRRKMGVRKAKFRSCIEIQSQEGKYCIVPVVYGKTGRINDVVSEIEAIDQVMSQCTEKIYPIIICSSIQEIKEAFERIDACVETPSQTTFALERDCAIGNVLSKLFLVEREGPNITYLRCEIV